MTRVVRSGVVFGVAACAAGLGALLILIGWALLRIARSLSTAAS